MSVSSGAARWRCSTSTESTRIPTCSKLSDLGGGEPRGQIRIVRRFFGANLQLAIATPVFLSGFLIGGVLGLAWDVQATQTVLTATVNGIVQCVGIDNTADRFTSGKPGFGITTFSGAVNQWDNFRYINLSAGGSIDMNRRSLATF